jgi:hypothetical protein
MTEATRNRTVEKMPKFTNDEKLLIWSFVLFANENVVREVFGRLFGFIGVPGAQTGAILFVYFPVVLVVFNRLRLRKRVGVAGFLLVISALGVLFAVSLFVHPEYGAVMFDSTWPFNIARRVFGPFSAVWAFLFVAMIGRVDPILAALKGIAYVSFVYGAINFAEAMQRGYWTGTSLAGVEIHQEYSLEFGYEMLVSVIVFIMLVFRNERRALNTILAFSGFAMILVGGNRAPVVFVLVAIVVLGFIFAGDKLRTSPTAFLGMLSFSAVIALIITNFEGILRVTGQMMEASGFSSRSLQAALDGSFGDDNGRTELQLLANELIANSGIFGYGMYGDRYHIVDHYWWGYPHNIVLEMQITFGAVLGVIILLILAALIFISFFKAPSFEYRLLLVFFSLLCLQLFVSLSYLYNPWFWALLATAYLALRNSQVKPHRSRAVA